MPVHSWARGDAVVRGAVEKDVFVYLVGIDPNLTPAFLPDHIGDLLKLPERSDASRGIGGEVQNDQLGLSIEKGRYGLAGKGKAVFLPQVNRDGAGTYIRNKGFIDGETGAGIDDLVAGVTIDLLRQAYGRLCAGKYHDPVGSCSNAAGLAEMVRNRGPKGKQSLGIAIMSIVEVDLSLYLVLDKLRNGKSGSPRLHFTTFLPCSSIAAIWGPILKAFSVPISPILFDSKVIIPSLSW